MSALLLLIWASGSVFLWSLLAWHWDEMRQPPLFVLACIWPIFLLCLLLMCPFILLAQVGMRFRKGRASS